MAGGGKIELFKFIQKNYQAIGIYPPGTNMNCHSINAKKWLIIFSLGQMFITSLIYLFVEAHSMIEYGMTFHTCGALVLSIIVYSILFWQMENILNYIENCERFVEKSE